MCVCEAIKQLGAGRQQSKGLRLLQRKAERREVRAGISSPLVGPKKARSRPQRAGAEPGTGEARRAVKLGPVKLGPFKLDSANATLRGIAILLLAGAWTEAEFKHRAGVFLYYACGAAPAASAALQQNGSSEGV